MNRLDSKIALITGGARGQGAAEAELFAEAGATVIITDVLDDEGKATAERLGGAVSYRHQDVTLEQDWADSVNAVIEQHGRVDVLVNNAGIFPTVPMSETSLEIWNRTVAINQTGVFLGMREVAPHMRAQGSGSIINISSIAGLGGTQIAFAYGATKWAVRGMSKSAAQDLGPHGVRVNSVHPGLIDTAMMDGFRDQLDEFSSAIPLGRVAQANEVGVLVRFLASEDASYCSGQEFVIDGAMTA